jgi:HlyD family secretion protein
VTTLPQTQPRRRPRLSAPWLIAAALLLALIGGLLFRTFVAGSNDPLAGRTTLTLAPASLVDGIAATGTVAPRLESKLAFDAREGRIGQIFVEEGDRVAQDQPLVTLESGQLAAAVQAAEAALSRAEADLLELQEGATPAEIAAAEAQVREAQAGLLETSGGVTAADLVAAQAAVEQARAQLAVLQAGPETSEVQAQQAQLEAAQAQLREAQANLQATRDERSFAKTAADQALAEATIVLQSAQSEYSEAYWRYKGVEDDGRVPASSDGENARELTDYGNLEQQEAFKRAELALKDAELNVQQAQRALDEARAAEVSAVSAAEGRVGAAEAEVRAAQAELDTLLDGADADEIAAARAQLASAEAQLVRLQGDERAGALGTGAARVDNAQARLDDLLADARPSALARATAAVAEAEAELEQARLNLANATLRAPFAGTVAAVNVAPGETISQVSPVTLIDDSAYKIDLTVDEVDIARVRVGQPVEVLIDALGAPALGGNVRLIAPSAVSGESVRTYAVTVVITPGERPLRPGMTASAQIVVDSREQAISVPRGALREENGRQLVDLVVREGGQVSIVPQKVRSGLRAGDRVEIVSGLAAGQEIALPGVEE